MGPKKNWKDRGQFATRLAPVKNRELSAGGGGKPQKKKHKKAGQLGGRANQKRGSPSSKGGQTRIKTTIRNENRDSRSNKSGGVFQKKGAKKNLSHGPVRTSRFRKPPRVVMGGTAAGVRGKGGRGKRKKEPMGWVLGV